MLYVSRIREEDVLYVAAWTGSEQQGPAQYDVHRAAHTDRGERRSGSSSSSE